MFHWFISKNPTFLIRNTNIHNFEKLFGLSCILQQICYFWGCLQKSWTLFWKTHLLLIKKNKIWTFLYFLITQWLSMAIFLRLNYSGFKKIKNLFQKALFKKTMKALRKFILSVAIRSTFATFIGFWKREFFSENLSTFFRKTQFLKSLKIFVFSVAFCCKLATFSNFKRSEIFSKNSYFLKKSTNFARFE